MLFLARQLFVGRGLLLRRRFLLPSNTCFVCFETAIATHGAPLLACFGILYVFSLALAAPTSSLLRRNFLGHK
jgi:hypothetical protein